MRERGPKSGRTAHRLKELLVGLGKMQLVLEELHRLDLSHGMEHLAQDPHLLQLFGSGKQFLAPRPGAVDVNGRIDALFGDFAGQMQLEVAGTLELLVDLSVFFRAL